MFVCYWEWLHRKRNIVDQEREEMVAGTMQRVDSLQKTLMLGGIGGRRRRGQQRMRWLDGITDSMGHEFVWTPGAGDGQGGLACCDSWGCRESDTTERLNWTELNWEGMQSRTRWRVWLHIGTQLSHPGNQAESRYSGRSRSWENREVLFWESLFFFPSNKIEVKKSRRSWRCKERREHVK